MRKIGRAALAAGAFLAPCWQGAVAAPREEALRADLVRGLTEVCLPAQVLGIEAKRYVKGKRRELGLTSVDFSNVARSNAWSLSTDRRAYVFSQKEHCYVSAEVRTSGGDRLVADLHADLAAMSGVEPSTVGDPQGAGFAAGYCAQMSDGSLASYNVRASVDGMEAGTGRIAPGQRLVVIVSAPRTSECGG